MSLLSFHIPFAQLVDLVERRLPVEEQAQLQAHVTTCPRCTQEVAQLERLLGLMRGDHAEDAPPQVIARVLRLFRPQPVATPEHPLRRILAALRFADQPLAPALGLRSAGATARQLLFTAGEYDIDIRIAPTAKQWSVSGQVLGDAEGSGRVALTGAAGRAEATINDQSEFVLPPVPAGDYRLILQLDTVEIEVDALQVGA